MHDCRLHVDDALDVSIVHGLSGLVGAVAIGFLATKEAHPGLVREGLFYNGGGELLRIQLMAIVTVLVYSITLSVALMWFLERVFVCATGFGLRIDEDDEVIGLDIIEHRETAYHEMDAVHENDEARGLMPLHFGESVMRARRTSASLGARGSSAGIDPNAIAAMARLQNGHYEGDGDEPLVTVN